MRDNSGEGGFLSGVGNHRVIDQFGIAIIPAAAEGKCCKQYDDGTARESVLSIQQPEKSANEQQAAPEKPNGKEEAKNSPAAAATLRYPIFCFIFFLLVEIIPPRRGAAVLMQ